MTKWKQLFSAVGATAVGSMMMITTSWASTTTLTTGSAMNFTANPTHRSQVNPAITTYYLDRGTPGTTIKESLTLSNQSSKTIEVHIFATTTSNGSDGNIVYGQSPESTWIRNLPTQVQLHPHQSEIIPFHIVVPSSASVGDHLFGISCDDGQNKGTILHEKKTGIAVGIKESVRRVIAVQVHIPGKSKVAFALQKATVGGYPSEQYYKVTGMDESNVILNNIDGQMTLYRGNQEVMVRHLSGLSFVPGQPITFQDNWVHGAAPIGSYHVHIALHGPALGNYSKTIDFKVNAPAVQHYDSLSGSKHLQYVTSTWAWWVIAGMAVLIVGLGGYIFVVRRRRLS